jgi:hypothetical protein
LPRLRISLIYHASESVTGLGIKVSYCIQSFVDEFAHRPSFFSQSYTAKEVMCYTFHFILCDLVGDDRKPLIKLHRISVDDFSIVLSRNLNGQLPTVINSKLLNG